jgi:hypothetical protein
LSLKRRGSRWHKIGTPKEEGKHREKEEKTMELIHMNNFEIDSILSIKAVQGEFLLRKFWELELLIS